MVVGHVARSAPNTCELLALSEIKETGMKVRTEAFDGE